MARAIGTLGTIPSLTIANRVFTDLTNLITLVAANQNLSYSTFRKSDGTPYQVPGGKVFHVYAAEIFSTTTNSFVYIGYGDNDVGFNTATIPTNPVYMGNDQQASKLLMRGGSTDIEPTQFAYEFKILAAKYPFMNDPSVANTTIKLYGYEE